jgi:hypothetical protein
MSETEVQRVKAIMDNSAIIYGLEGVNPMLIQLLDQISLDVEWLCDRLNIAWSTVNAYQEEIRIQNKGR